MTISSLVFPSFLSNPAYENKKVTFKALKPTEFSVSDPKIVSIKKSIDYVLPGAGEKALDFINEKIDETVGIPDGFNLDSSVTLPYPISLSDNQNHNWENTEGIVSQVTSNVLGASGESLGANVGGVVKKILGDSKKMYAGLMNSLGVRKAIVDPGYFQNYNGSTPRSFTLAYTLVPQSQKEAQTIKDIILWFKQYSSPTFVPNTPLMGAPFIFNISFAGNQYITDMFKMDKCVLTGISVDYASDGSFMLFKDGFPKQIGLALNFAEVELKYAQDYAGLVKKEVTDKRSKLGSKDGSNRDSKKA